MEAEMPEHLMDIDPDDFAVKRKRRGKGYRYLNASDSTVEDNSVLDVVKHIPVPDTWSDVTLSHQSNTYILARGYDGSGKLQYLYHPDYLEHRNSLKFERLVEFGKILPRIRRRLKRDTKGAIWSERKLLALVVQILDKYHLRIGSRVYSKTNNSFGLTTLRKKHLLEQDNSLVLNFIGKSGQPHTINLTDHRLVELLSEVAEFPGWELFSFKTDEGKFSADASGVNEYIRQISGEHFSARDFRTWAGTVLTVKYLPKARKVVQQNPKRKLSSTVVEMVAKKLGNTPAICRKYYIHPEVLSSACSDKFECEPCEEKFLKNSLYRKHECRTLEILTKL